jgi:hypothetical protein
MTKNTLAMVRLLRQGLIQHLQREHGRQVKAEGTVTLCAVKRALASKALDDQAKGIMRTWASGGLWTLQKKSK